VQELQEMKWRQFTPEERQRAPIKKLRQLLANPGHREISQEQLTRYLDIDLKLLQRVEYGRTTFNQDLQHRVRCEIGAIWHPKDLIWRFWTLKGPEYTRKHFDQYRALLTKGLQSGIAPLDILFATTRVELLLQTLPSLQRFRFLFDLNTFLEKQRSALCPKLYAQMFEDMSAFVGVNPERDRETPMEVFYGYPPRLLDFVKQEPQPDGTTRLSFNVDAYEKALRSRPKSKKVAQSVSRSRL
jgi:hypothetical protein